MADSKRSPYLQYWRNTSQKCGLSLLSLQRIYKKENKANLSISLDVKQLKAFQFQGTSPP